MATCYLDGVCAWHIFCTGPDSLAHASTVYLLCSDGLECIPLWTDRNKIIADPEQLVLSMPAKAGHAALHTPLPAATRPAQHTNMERTHSRTQTQNCASGLYKRLDQGLLNNGTIVAVLRRSTSAQRCNHLAGAAWLVQLSTPSPPTHHPARLLRIDTPEAPQQLVIAQSWVKQQ
jgi:hypothetical protein